MGFNRGVQPIITELRNQLKQVGRQRWPDIAAHTGCKESFIRKLAYGDKKNPGLQRIERLRAYFAQAHGGDGGRA
jgi:predicted transcriptional regulator